MEWNELEALVKTESHVWRHLHKLMEDSDKRILSAVKKAGYWSDPEKLRTVIDIMHPSVLRLHMMERYRRLVIRKSRRK